ncbi:hypothetical protein PSTG_09986 [Puccinia striiformis f. sp. tritici PST-78]|uniref:CCHC-type domain-containing protein n=1 Tax=Puccinia striiformis f. sp. tritici PST-78 TaxID=1165861 RepID=A0A0L0VBR0_9BASI|nr:hypothetical protein PSTG_09986 [Puccinia striiformis f. sp. tritici PST-78]
MPYRTTNNPSPLIPSVPVMDGSSVTFPAWRSRLKDVLSIQGVLDIVKGTLLRPETDAKLGARPAEHQTGYYPEEYATDWDFLSEQARSTIKFTMSSDLLMRYHDVKPASPKWIAKIRIAANNLTSAKLTPNDQQICDRLLRGLDESWKTIRDHLVYSPTEVSLDDAIGALEAHKIATSSPFDQPDNLTSALAAKAKQRIGCWNCGQRGHHSTKCTNPPSKNKKVEFKSRAGAVSHVGLRNNTEYEDKDSFDENDVHWG